jgi:predicted outer membrane repeat protein
MFKKMMLVGLTIMMFSGSLFAGGGGSKQSRFEDYISDSLKIEHPLFQKVFPRVEFFVESSYITIPQQRRIVGKLDGKIFGLPIEFNKLFKEISENSKATIEEKMELFTLFYFWLQDENSTLLSIEQTNEEIDDIIFNYKIQVIVNKSKYEVFIKIISNQIKRVEFYHEGKRSNLLNLSLASIDFRDVNISIVGITPITYGFNNHYYVVVSENGTTLNNSVTFEVSGLEPNQTNVILIVQSVPSYGSTNFLTHPLSVNELGNASYIWIPPNNNNTGFCEIKVDADGVITTLDDSFIIPEHTTTGTFTSGYSYTIYFCNQFFDGHGAFPTHPLGITHAQTFAGYVETAANESWNEQVNNWVLAQGCINDQPEDFDSNYEIVINDHDGANNYHGMSDNAATIGDERVIGIRYDSHLTENLYTTEEDRINIAVSHEFYHGIQMSHNPISSFGSYFIEMFWMIEGQARFLPSVQYPDEEFYVETTQHFFPVDANSYLSNTSPLYLNTSLNDLSYSYCLFWRSLYENYSTGSTAEKLEVIRETCRGNTNHNLPDIETFIDSKLSENFDTMDDVIRNFATNCYLNDTTYGLWNPCPSDAFYETPFITAANRNGITNTFTGERNVTETDAIAEPFGIDYMIFTIAPDVSNVCLNFDGDPDNDSNMADFYANALLMEGNDLILEQEISLTDGEGVISFVPNDPINKIVLVIARLDSDETRENDYEVILSDEENHKSGNVFGTWSNETYSTYIIDGDITVSAGNTLILEPGIEIVFSGHYKFNVYGKLLALGTEDANINFTAQNQATGWHGLRLFNQNANGQEISTLSYCNLLYGRANGTYPDNNGGAIYCDNSNININNSIISNNSATGAGGAICLFNGSTLDISSSVINNNTASEGGAIFSYNPMYVYSYPILSGVTIHNNSAVNNGGAIYSNNYVYTLISNCTIVGNVSDVSNPYSGGGIYAAWYGNTDIDSSIFWNNQPYSIWVENYAGVNVDYSDVEGGWYGPNNIDANPLFADAANGDFNLTWTDYPVDNATKSPCIDSGNPYYTDPDGTIKDIGSHYFYQGSGTTPPANVVIEIDNGFITINWSGSRTDDYKVYSSDNPYTGFTEDLTGTYDGTSWSAPFISTESKKFYYVTSGNEREQSQTENPEKSKRTLK